MGKLCRNIRAQWTENTMAKALELLRKGKSQRFVAKEFNIPRTTLRNHLKSGSFKKKLGRGSILTEEQEAELEARIVRLCDIGLPLTPKSVRRSVYRYCVENNISHKFNSSKEMAGFTWYKAFLRRHPKISKRKAQSLNAARAIKLNPQIVKDHFEKLKKVIEDLGFKNSPERIYNLDEKGCRLTLHHTQTVLAPTGSHRVHLVSNEHGENATVVACVSALGHAVPPMVIFKGIRMKEIYKDNLPPGSTVEMAQKGSMTRYLFIKWLQHFSKFKPEGNVLLILDGASCHLDIQIVIEAEKYGVTLYCLPSNTTHELQPLDKAVFRSFEHHWDVELLRYWEGNLSSNRCLKKERFGIVFSRVWQQCMTISNIQSGFQSTGIYPFDPTVIPEVAFAPSVLTINKNNGNFNTNESEDDDSEDNLPLIHFVNNRSNSKQTPQPGCSKWTDEEVTTKFMQLNQKISPLSEINYANNNNLISNSNIQYNFSSLLSTPNFAIKKQKPRRKAMNYKAQLLKKDLFSELSSSKEENPLQLRQSSKENEDLKESWMCSVCNKNFVADMRRCETCSKWVHEICVGLTSEDTEEFQCPNCML